MPYAFAAMASAGRVRNRSIQFWAKGVESVFWQNPARFWLSYPPQPLPIAPLGVR